MVTVLDILQEIRVMIKDKTVYEFLQFEPRNHYHDVDYFITIIETWFHQSFDKDLAEAMELADEKEQRIFFINTSVMSSLPSRKKKIFDDVTNTYENPLKKS